MSLNPQYMIAPSLQEFFIDKRTGLPLVGGKVYFFSDNNRLLLKDIFELSGSPPNYSYVPLDNPVTLSGVGTFEDADGNDIIPYYYPYDSDGNIELYFVRVYDSLGEHQWDRQAWPNFTGSSSSSSLEIINYIPNGQFVLHNDNYPLNTAALGSTSIDYTPIAQGGYYFARTHGSSATDTISFIPIDSYTANPAGSPRFTCQIIRSASHADPVCDLRVRFYDVNKFSSLDTTIQYLFQFTAISGTGSTLSNVNINLYKYFGTGTNSPSAPELTNISVVNIGITQTVINTPIFFGDNIGKTIGDNNDDFVEICINFNTGVNSLFNIELTDFILTLTQSVDNFPTTTNDQFLSASLVPPPPASNGMSLWLPIVLTPQGYGYDTSVIGTIIASTYSATYLSNNNFPYLLCDGSTKSGSLYSSTTGIPYYRLLSQFLNDSPLPNVPKFGTGPDFATLYIGTANTSLLRLSVNKGGAVADTVDGTGGIFTVETIHNGGFPPKYSAYNTVANTVLCIGSFTTPAFAATADTSGFTITTSPSNSSNTNPDYSFTLQAVSAAALANPGGAGKYFRFGDDSVHYNMWFQITNETDPGASGTAIKVNLQATYGAQEVANVIREAMSGFEQTTIICATGSLASKYVSFQVNPGGTANYYWWYKVDGVGTDPHPTGQTGILVNILSTDTSAQIAQKTQLAINSYQFALPNLQGMFLRGLDNADTPYFDLDIALRLSTLTSISGANVGTIEYNQVLSHVHPPNGGHADDKYLYKTASSTSDSYSSGSGNLDASTDTGSYGGTETRPVNFAVNWLIRY